MSIKTKLESSKGALAHDSTFFSFFNSHALMRPTMMALHSALLRHLFSIFLDFLSSCSFEIYNDGTTF